MRSTLATVDFEKGPKGMAETWSVGPQAEGSEQGLKPVRGRVPRNKRHRQYPAIKVRLCDCPDVVIVER